MTNPNYFFVNRALLHSDRWLSEPFTRGQAWIDLFGLAQHSTGFFRVRGIKVNLKRGQLGYSQLTLANRWRWSRDKVRRYLRELENNGDIIQQNNEVTTVITVTKYDLWQKSKTTNDTTEKQQKNIKRYTYKNDKNDKNDNSSLKGRAKLKADSPDSMKKGTQPETEPPMNQDIDRSFPRKHLWGDESLNWLLDYFEHKFGREPLDQEKWSRIYLSHLKRKVGLGKVKEVIDWASDPDCWWYSKLTGFKMLYNKRDMILRQVEDAPKQVNRNKALNLNEIE